MMGEQRFSVIPVRAVTDKNMPVPVFRTLAALGLFTDKNGWCYPSLRALSELLGVSRSRVSRHIKWLAEHGYLNVLPQYNTDGSRGTNRIQVRFDYQPEDDFAAETPPEAEDEPSKTAEDEPQAGEGVLRPAQQGVSPSATGGVSPSATGVAPLSATGVAPLSATGVAPLSATLTPQLTSQLTPQVNARLQQQQNTPLNLGEPAADAVAAVAANLPDEIRDALKALGWTGGMGEVAAAWQQDPARVRAWVEHAQRKGWSAALLRAVLREDPGYPPREPDPVQRYLGDYAPPEPDDAATPNAPSPPQPPPDLPAPVRRWWQLAVGQLAAEMPKASFDAWVRPAFPLAFADANGGGGPAMLTVAAANDYAREWLAERLTKTLERKLAGLAGKPVRVQFVVQEDGNA